MSPIGVLGGCLRKLVDSYNLLYFSEILEEYI